MRQISRPARSRAVAIAAAALALVAAAAAPRTAGADDFDSAGVNIHYTVEGAGEPVVLIHGLYSSAQINWKLPGIVADLAESYRVIAFDARGHGRSDKPEDDGAYGTQMVEDVVRLLDHLKVRRAHVVGYSMGGMIALKLVALHPERVRSAVLGGMGWLQEGSALQKSWEMLPGRGGKGVPPACLHGFTEFALTEAAVRAIRVPVDIVIGTRDPVSRLYVAPLKNVRPDWPVVEIEGAGHMNCILKPDFKAALRAALERHAGSAAAPQAGK